jgi:hypothetical protein
MTGGHRHCEPAATPLPLVKQSSAPRELKMDNVVFWRLRVLPPSFSIIHLSFSIRAKRALPFLLSF